MNVVVNARGEIKIHDCNSNFENLHLNKTNQVFVIKRITSIQILSVAAARTLAQEAGYKLTFSFAIGNLLARRTATSFIALFLQKGSFANKWKFPFLTQLSVSHTRCFPFSFCKDKFLFLIIVSLSFPQKFFRLCG